MITILHGDDTKQSRSEYLLIRQRAKALVTLEGSSFDQTALLEALTGDGLFDENKAVFIENILSKRKKSKELDALISILNSNPEKDITLWEGKEIDKKVLLTIPKASVKLYKLPQVLFLFLDNLKPGNGPLLVSLFHQALVVSEAELLFVMLVRQFRLFLALTDTTSEPIDDLKRLSPWQEQKLRKQAQLFGKKELVTVYNQLFSLDHAQKTGGLAQPLSSSIDILLLSL